MSEPDWRVLAYKDSGAEAVHIKSDGSRFDELVVQEWLHIEEMGDGWYWMRLQFPGQGPGIVINVRTTPRKGLLREVHIEYEGGGEDQEPDQLVVWDELIDDPGAFWLQLLKVIKK